MKAKIILRPLLLILFILSSTLMIGQKATFNYICPIPGSSNLNPEQNIILKCDKGIDPLSLHGSSIFIEGSKSGPLATEFIFSSDNKTLITKPVRAFQKGEIIYANIQNGLKTSNGETLEEKSFEFSIISHNRNEVWQRLSQLEAENTPPEPIVKDNYLIPAAESTLPSDYPVLTVYSHGPHDDEYIFANFNCRNPSLPWNKFIAIFDSYGTPIFFQESELNRINFGPLPDGTLCYATNLVINTAEEKYYILDSSYALVDSVNTGNGYILDAHELLLLNNGHYLVMSYDPQPVDMSQIVPGGDPNAIVTGLIIQEVDNNQNVYFQWRSWDHFLITDATSDIDLTAPSIDYVHGNAFEIDQDGNILLSSRHLDEITKISFTTGDVLWRFGKNSENNMFSVQDDPEGFTHQHDIELIYNGHYTVFDNGNLRNPKYSRVLEYWIDEANLTAELVWEYDRGKTIYAGSAGSFRTQPNGERIIGWGGTFPEAITELQADNSLLREFFFPNYVNSYRAIKASWETNVFNTRANLSMGNYSPETGKKENYLYIYNESDKIIKISSIDHHLPEFEIFTELPISIFPNSYSYVHIGFLPLNAGTYADRFTLNHDNADTSQRIARQLEIKGHYSISTPTLSYDPFFGASSINPSTQILVTFSQPVRKVIGGEITNDDIPSLFELKTINWKGENIPFSGTINEDKSQITLIPGNVLEENQQYYVKLKGNLVSDYEGNIMVLDEESYFTTGLYTGIEIIQDAGVHIYPSPFSDKLHVQGLLPGTNHITIYSATGQRIMEREYQASEINIQVPAIEPGLYFIIIYNKESGESMTYKVMKSTASF